MQGNEFFGVPAERFAPGVFARKSKEEAVPPDVAFVVEPENVLGTRGRHSPFRHDGIVEKTASRDGWPRDEKPRVGVALNLAVKIFGKRSERHNLRALLVDGIFDELQVHFENDAEQAVAADCQAKQFPVPGPPAATTDPTANQQPKPRKPWITAQ